MRCCSIRLLGWPLCGRVRFKSRRVRLRLCRHQIEFVSSGLALPDLAKKGPASDEVEPKMTRVGPKSTRSMGGSTQSVPTSAHWARCARNRPKVLRIGPMWNQACPVSANLVWNRANWARVRPNRKEFRPIRKGRVRTRRQKSSQVQDCVLCACKPQHEYSSKRECENECRTPTTTTTATHTRADDVMNTVKEVW